MAVHRRQGSDGGVGDVFVDGGAPQVCSCSHIQTNYALSDKHQQFVIKIITEFHEIATTSYSVTRAVCLGKYMYDQQSELMAKKREKLSGLAAVRFLHTNADLKSKVVESVKALDIVCWTALNVGISFVYDPLKEARIRQTIEHFKSCNEEIATSWDVEQIMTSIKEGDFRKLMGHVLPEAFVEAQGLT